MNDIIDTKIMRNSSSWINVIESDYFNVIMISVIAIVWFYILANVVVLAVFGFFPTQFANPYYSTMKVSDKHVSL